MTAGELRSKAFRIMQCSNVCQFDSDYDEVLDELIFAVLTQQYDAIMAAVRNAPVVIRLDTYAMYTTILDAIAKHDPRKGAI